MITNNVRDSFVVFNRISLMLVLFCFVCLSFQFERHQFIRREEECRGVIVALMTLMVFLGFLFFWKERVRFSLPLFFLSFFLS